MCCFYNQASSSCNQEGCITCPSPYVNYQFACHCNSWYIGHTSQSLQECIKQHVLRSIKNHHFSQHHSIFPLPARKNSTSQIIAHDSAIGQHLLKNSSCATQYSVPNSLSFQEDVLISNSLLLKLHLSNLFNLIYVDTRNFLTV